MSHPHRTLADLRLWMLFLLLGMTLTVSACGSSDESCNEGDSDYPECLETGPTG
jgi:hypothetical protein